VPRQLVPAPVSFTEEWFGEASQQTLAELYELVVGLRGHIVEIGCWEGRSTCALANACSPHVVRAVDTWQGSPGEISEQLAAERDVYATFLENVAALTTGNVRPFRMSWRDYFAERAGPIRFLHIDATHTYEEVRDNILAALPHMVPGAVICGDDAHHPPVQRAVIETLGRDVKVKATLWCKQL
jgi:hypothetical protein